MPSYDLTDPLIAESIGSALFDDIGWERRAGRWTIIGDGPAPLPEQVILIQTASNDIPPALSVEPRQLVRTGSVGLSPDHPASGSVAIAKGPDVFLLDGAFGTNTRWSVGRVLSHELVHVAQWYELSDAYVGAARAGNIATLRLRDGSDLVAAWAAATGWEDSDPDPFATRWQLTGEPPNEYARTDPAEDMAESVSLIVSGLTDLVDAPRTTFIENWLGVDVEVLAVGKPWAPPTAIEVSSVTPLYDQEATGSVNASRADALYFELPDADLDEIATHAQARLTGRQFSGTLTPSESSWAGMFSHPDGSSLWVELADPGAGESLLLIYVWLW